MPVDLYGSAGASINVVCTVNWLDVLAVDASDVVCWSALSDACNAD